MFLFYPRISSKEWCTPRLRKYPVLSCRDCPWCEYRHLYLRASSDSPSCLTWRPGGAGCLWMSLDSNWLPLVPAIFKCSIFRVDPWRVGWAAIRHWCTCWHRPPYRAVHRRYRWLCRRRRSVVLPSLSRRAHRWWKVSIFVPIWVILLRCLRGNLETNPKRPAYLSFVFLSAFFRIKHRGTSWHWTPAPRPPPLITIPSRGSCLVLPHGSRVHYWGISCWHWCSCFALAPTVPIAIRCWSPCPLWCRSVRSATRRWCGSSIFPFLFGRWSCDPIGPLSSRGTIGVGRCSSRSWHRFARFLFGGCRICRPGWTS